MSKILQKFLVWSRLISSILAENHETQKNPATKIQDCKLLFLLLKNLIINSKIGMFASVGDLNLFMLRRIHIHCRIVNILVLLIIGNTLETIAIDRRKESKKRALFDRRMEQTSIILSGTNRFT